MPNVALMRVRKEAKSGKKRQNQARIGEKRQKLAKDPWISIGQNQAKIGKKIL